jgi:hypothetical protein
VRQLGWSAKADSPFPGPVCFGKTAGSIRSVTHRDPDSSSDRDPYWDADPYGDPNRVPHADTNSDPYTYANPDSHAGADRD